MENADNSSSSSPKDNGLPLTNLDDLQLQAQGHEQELPRQFNLLSMLSFSFSIMNSWIGFVSILFTLLQLGGPPTAFWSSFVGCCAATIIGVGLAELASAFPTSGGQYHFAFVVSPPKYREGISFLTAWWNILAYLFCICSATLWTSQSTIGLVVIYNPEYEMQKWHVFLVYCAYLLVATAAVTLGSSLIPKVQSAFFWASIVGVVVSSITVLAASDKKQSGQAVVSDWDNESGWNLGFAFMLAVGQTMWSFVAVDSCCHIAEEIPQPGKNLPVAMLLAFLVGILTNTLYSAAILFTCTDFKRVAASTFPIQEAYLQSTGSPIAAGVLAAWVVFIFFGVILAMETTSGRLIWAFSRDNGMPFSDYWKAIDETLKVPVRANILTCVFCIVWGFIYLGSTVAFNTFISTALLFMNASYAMPQACLLFGDREKLLPARGLNLGKAFGIFCNLFSLLWVLLCFVLFCAPIYLPINVASMNYNCVVIAGAFLFVSILWYGAGKKRTFVGPKFDMEAMNAFNAAARESDSDDEKAKTSHV